MTPTLLVPFSPSGDNLDTDVSSQVSMVHSNNRLNEYKKAA